MLSFDIKKEVASLWDIVSSAGLAPSPYVALEQIACLIFLKRLHGLDVMRSNDGVKPEGQERLPVAGRLLSEASSLWKELLNLEDIGHCLEQEVFPWLRTLGQEMLFARTLNGVMDDVYFQLDVSKHQALKLLIRHIDALFSEQASNEAHSPGEVLDQLFAQASINSKIGQLTTAPQIARFMVSLLDPVPEQSIIDPTVGTGTLLVSALEYIRENMSVGDRALPGNADSLVGIDLDHAQTRIAWVNLLLHGVASPVCVQGNSLAAPEGVAGELLRKQYDFVLADAPFGGRVDLQESLSPNEHSWRDRNASTDRVELLFIWRALALLKPGGRAALIIPQSVLSGSDEPHVNLRRELLSQHQIEAVIYLPRKVYAPFTGISAALLLVRKPSTPHFAPNRPGDEPKTGAVWFYEVSDDGLSAAPQKAGPVNTDNDLLDALVHFKHRKVDQGLWESNKDLYFQSGQRQDPQAKFLSTLGTLSRSATKVKQWQIPVRTWQENPESRSVDGAIQSSHDDSGSVRPEYVQRMESRLYVLGKLDSTLLDRDCIEAKDWSLELSRYKPIVQPKSVGDQSVLQLIDDLEFIEKDILGRLHELRNLIGPAK